MESWAGDERSLNPRNGKAVEEKPKLVVIMGSTGSGKSKLAIDLASHFPIEIINADSMQLYQGLDVLTNKLPLQHQNGVPHHLLGTVSPNVEFTSKEFRDSAIPIINKILSRNHIPVIVGGTNYYIQALVSPFLLDDSAEDMDESCPSDLLGDEQTDLEPDFGSDTAYSYENLKDLDPVAAKRIHPNNHRKISQYLSLYARSGVLPSKIYQGKAAEVVQISQGIAYSYLFCFCPTVMAPSYFHPLTYAQRQNWGRVDNFRFNCCFICTDAATPVLDQYVEQRVDSMIDAGLLHEVCNIYNVNADYTRGLQQAIGVREFEDFLKVYLSTGRNSKTEPTGASCNLASTDKDDKTLKEYMREILNSSNNNQLKVLLEGAIDKVKLNTRRLVRCQKRRVNRLQTLFGWNIHYVDATESISCKSDESWASQVVGPAVEIIRTFLSEEDDRSVSNLMDPKDTSVKSTERDLWTQYICKACGDRVLRGAHEWEQHKQGRRHRKRMSHLRKSQGFGFLEQQQLQQQQKKTPYCG